MTKNKISRRQFLQKTGSSAVLLSALNTTIPHVHAGESHTIRIALVGCGGRGSGAAVQALSTEGPTQLVAVADIFPDRMNGFLEGVTPQFADTDKIDCPPERQFLGFDAYKKAIDVLNPGDVVLLATPPAFRPVHVEYAVSKGVHIFMEKSFAVDVPGLKRMQKSMETARTKGLKILSGLYSRHFNKYNDCINMLHNGAIGDIMTIYSYREHGEIACAARGAEETELGYQIRRYSNFTWVNGSFYLDWLIHNLDVANWIKGDHPVSCQGQGGRQVYHGADQVFDHHCVEYTYSDGKRCIAQARHQNNTWGFFGVIVHGTKGAAVVGEGVTDPGIFSDWNMSPDKRIWFFNGTPNNGYQTEHDVFFDAIRNNRECDESDYAITATMTGIMGRMAFESGQLITWDDAWNNPTELTPGIDNMTWESTPYVLPDANGQYPIARPGIDKPR